MLSFPFQGSVVFCRKPRSEGRLRHFCRTPVHCRDRSLRRRRSIIDVALRCFCSETERYNVPLYLCNYEQFNRVKRACQYAKIILNIYLNYTCLLWLFSIYSCRTDGTDAAIKVHFSLNHSREACRSRHPNLQIYYFIRP